MMGLGHLRGVGARAARLPSADVDFDFLAGRIDFGLTCARTGISSQTDSSRRISISPHNLCLYSEQFNIGWARENVSAFGAGSVSDAVRAPDGEMSADIIDDGASSGRHILYQYRAIPGEGIYVASVFLKDLGRRFAQLKILPISQSFGAFIVVDLVDGLVSQSKSFGAGLSLLSSGIELLADGWARVWFCFEVIAGAAPVYFVISASDRPIIVTSNLMFQYPIYAGSGKKLAVWGAQLELIPEAGAARPYVCSIGSPGAGLRLDHDAADGAPRGLLIEEARTNLVLLSQAPLSQTISVAAQPYTLSFYGSGSISLSGAASAIVSGAGAYPARRTFTFTPVAGALSLAVSGDVRFAQCELGSFVTSWIPTWNAASLRGADDVRVDAINLPWLSPSAGTFCVEASRLSGVSRGDVLHLRNSANAALGDINVSGAGGALDVSMRKPVGVLNASSQDAFSSASGARAAFAYGAEEGAVSINGSSAISSSGVLGPSQVNAMTIGSNLGPTRNFLNGHVRRIRYYRRRLSNALLQQFSG